MSDLMLQPHAATNCRDGHQDGHRDGHRADPGTGHQVRQADRRRPGRMANPSPELIQLMRKPTATARARVALYDAPGFLLQSQPRRLRGHRRSLLHTVVAMVACSAATAAMFQGMLFVWG